MTTTIAKPLARLVYDGGAISIPPEMGKPREDQLRGSSGEMLIELAGRVCYDSLGHGRPSFTSEVVTGADPHTGEQILKTVEGYHDHIHQVGHGSVWEHFNFTARIKFDSIHNMAPPPHVTPTAYQEMLVATNRKLMVAFQCANRPGVICLPTEDGALRITMNIRSVIEWSNWTKQLYGYTEDQFRLDDQLSAALALCAKELCPGVVKLKSYPISWPEIQDIQIVAPSNDHEKWITLYLVGSRGFSHELVRHGDFTAISQRSTRYVDESKSPWIEHPLISTWKEEALRRAWRSTLHVPRWWRHEDAAREMYDSCVETLEPWLLGRGVDKQTARKQARGAARGYLGNALQTEVIFSASVAQWRRILDQRASRFADAEIREVAIQALHCLHASRYRDRFLDYRVEPSPDGIGHVAIKS
jgi:hypothetical protein